MKAPQVIDRTHPPPSPRRGRDRIVILGSPEWVAWVERLSVTARLPIPVLIDNALARFASGMNAEQPPPRMS